MAQCKLRKHLIGAHIWEQQNNVANVFNNVLNESMIYI